MRLQRKSGSLPTLEVIAVYGEEPDAPRRDVQVKFWDQVTVTHLLLLIAEYKKGRLDDQFITLTLTDEDKEKLEFQGVPIEGLSHLLFDIENGKTC